MGHEGFVVYITTPRNPFLFRGFFQRFLFSIQNFQITLVYFLFCNPVMDYVQPEVGMDRQGTCLNNNNNTGYTYTIR